MNTGWGERGSRWNRSVKALDFFQWANGVLAQVSARSPLAEALRYAVRLTPALLAYTEDGRLEIDSNVAENALRGIAVGRKNWLFNDSAPAQANQWALPLRPR